VVDVPQHPLGYRVPDSMLERLLGPGSAVYWSIGAAPSVPKPPGPNLLDLLDPKKRPPRARAQRQRPRIAARKLGHRT
jgi:hypothetical protein